jgi:hypothetical protein
MKRNEERVPLSTLTQWSSGSGNSSTLAEETFVFFFRLSIKRCWDTNFLYIHC